MMLALRREAVQAMMSGDGDVEQLVAAVVVASDLVGCTSHDVRRGARGRARRELVARAR